MKRTERLCQNCEAYLALERICSNYASPRFGPERSPDDSCEFFQGPQSRLTVAEVIAGIVGGVIGYGWSILMWVLMGAVAYSWVVYSDPLKVPTELSHRVIDEVVLLIYGCDGPRMPNLCPQ